MKIITYGKTAHLFVHRFTVVVGCFLLTFFCLLGAVTVSALKQENADSFIPTHTVIVDPGHGGLTNTTF